MPTVPAPQLTQGRATFQGARCYTRFEVVTTFSSFRFPELSQPI
jgi:hypothetical protein